MTFHNMRRAAGLAPTLSFALSLLSGCSSPSTPPAPPAEGVAQPEAADGVRRNPVVAGRPGRVFVMAGFGERCESLPAPQIRITQPPSKGSVSFEPGQATTINTSASGTCIGKIVTGTGIYYTARPGETGKDSFAIEAEIGGSATQRSFTVEIVE